MSVTVQFVTETMRLVDKYQGILTQLTTLESDGVRHASFTTNTGDHVHATPEMLRHLRRDALQVFRSELDALAVELACRGVDVETMTVKFA